MQKLTETYAWNRQDMEILNILEKEKLTTLY